MNSTANGSNMIHIALLVVIGTGVFLLWSYPVLIPLKLLVVFFHEASHALAVVLTGGKVHELVVVFQQGGHVRHTGGNYFIIASAGYLGSLAWGALIYLIAMNTHWDRITMGVLALAVGAITIAFGGNDFVLGYGIVTCVVMLLAAKYLYHDINDFLLRLIGLTSMLYVPQDIYSDTIARANTVQSDARNIADIYGGTTVFWGSVWMIISVVVILLCLIWTFSHSRAPRRRT